MDLRSAGWPFTVMESVSRNHRSEKERNSYTYRRQSIAALRRTTIGPKVRHTAAWAPGLSDDGM
jgi:hypothetical protein